MIAMIQAALGRTRTVLMLFVLLLVSGVVTYQSIPKESEPDVPIPFFYVSIGLQGISPEDAERMLVRPMESELRSLEGLKQMSATASEGHASINLEFIPGMDSKQVLTDVREKVDLAKAELPEDADEPTVTEVSLAAAFPAVTVMLSGPVPERTLVAIGRELQERIEAFKEVLEVEIGGDREDIVEIIVDPLLMESYNLDLTDIGNMISRHNRLVAAGTLDTGHGSFAIKVPSTFDSVQEIFDMPIKVEGDRVIAFKDVAQVRRSFKDPTSYARLNGQSTISLEVKKRGGENMIETVDKVKALVSEAQQLFPPNVEVTYTGDRSTEVKQMLGDLQNNVLSAVLLVVIVVVAALGIRSSGLVGVAIPGSFLTGILVLSLFGFTVNIVVLFALIMAVGMLVDGAIVVVELADRLMSEGHPRGDAYRQAAMRMAWPITASTATTLAAFAPLMFWPGMMGEFMKYLPFTLIATLTASLAMALIFIPVLGSLFGASRPLSVKARHQLELTETGDLSKVTGFTGLYLRTLALAVKLRWLVVVGMLAFAGAVFTMYYKSDLGLEFFPAIEPTNARMVVRSFGDLSIQEKDQLMKRVESQLLDMEGVETFYTRVGGKDQIGTIQFTFEDWKERAPAVEIIAEARQRVSGLAGIEVEVVEQENGPSQGKAFTLELSSRYPELLAEHIRLVKQAMVNSGQFVNIEDSAPKPGIEWQLKVDRADAARFDADAALLGSSVQMVTSGLKLGGYRTDDVDDELDILVRFPEEKRSIARLDDLRIKTRTGMVPVTNFVERTARPKVDSISKVDGRRVMEINADLAPGMQLDKVLPQMEQRLRQMAWDERVGFRIRGENEDQAESMDFLMKAFAVALFVMAIILVTQFNSFYQAFLILSAVVFSTVGVFLGQILLKQPFNVVMSGIGVIALAGIVVNNNIVLIDTFNVLRRQGMTTYEAILRTGAQRLRPVMLTTITTILGLLPMVTQVNIDLVRRTIEVGGPSTQWWVQLSTAVAGGLTFATLLTLVFTPCLLAFGSGRRLYSDGSDDQQPEPDLHQPTGPVDLDQMHALLVARQAVARGDQAEDESQATGSVAGRESGSDATQADTPRPVALL